MARLNLIVVAFLCGILLPNSKCQSIKGGSRSVKSGSYSQYQSQSSLYQEQTRTSCDRPSPPMNGRFSCQMSLNAYTCTGSCNVGYIFPNNRESMELECSQSGEWLPFGNFPECVPVEEPAQRQHYSQNNAGLRASCDRPNPPMNGRLSCQMASNRYTCTGSCNTGYTFPDERESMELECSQLSGVWLPYRNFPDCVAGSYEGDYGSSQRTYRREYSHSASSSYGGGYGQSHGQSQQTRQNSCGSPRSPMNGQNYCSMSNGQWTCQGTCNPSYSFPSGERQMTLTCHDRDGLWSPTAGFPPCTLQCHPECQNGGRCVENNQCLCPSSHRGNRCQYSVALCDFYQIAPKSVYSSCAHSADFTECQISCPPGMTFQPPSSPVFRCTVDGLWNPPIVPECVKDSLCERPPPPMHGRIECQGSTEIMLCRGVCMAGYLFPEGFSELSIQCVRRTGEWSPDVGFPDCEPTCNPACQNGGKCLGHNNCLCPKGYRGGRCQYPTSNCDGHDRFAAVAWSCKNGERETLCNISCGQSASKLQPPEPTVYTCSLDGSWQPDLKPICVTDYSQIDRRSSTNERYEIPETSHMQPPGYIRPNSGRETNRNPYEFGGQQTVDYDFGGQQPVDYDIGGQQPIDHNFDNGKSRQNLGGYPSFGQKPVDHGGEPEPQVAQRQNNYRERPYTRQEEGKEAFDKGLKNVGSREREQEELYTLTNEDAQEVVKQVETLTEENNGDVFSTIDRASGYHGICSVWGYHHYRSFDGGVFTFPSACPYVLASDCEHENLVISLLTQCDMHAPCERTIGIQLQDNTYVISYHRGLTQNGMSLPIPTHIGELTVEKIARYLVARLTTGFTIWINDENTVLIVASQFMKNRTCGMCGNFDGYLDPKFIRSDGSKTNDIYSFANSWKRDWNGICVDNSEHTSPCSADSRNKRLASDRANLLCASLYDAEFHSCIKFVDPDIYYAKCQMDCCSLMSEEDCECASIGEFILECSRNGVVMKKGWRKPGLCPLTCNNGTQYRECGPPCPPTCDDQEPTCQQERCVDGCHCPKGTVLENGQCITIDQCPCHHGQRIYASGETMEQDCNTCVCQGGNWQCTDSICPATCSISGPHYQTFDGLLYDFSGQCSHYLVETEDYNVQIDYSNNCREMASYTSVCIRSLTIHTPEGAVVKLKQTMEVSVNGREMIGLPVLAPGVYVGQGTSEYIRAQLNNGMEIMWDMDSSIQIYAPLGLFKELRGLCGTFTKNQQDDFLTPEGDVEKSSQVFAQKWKVEESCIDYSMLPGAAEQDKPCDRFPSRRMFAARVCSVIKEDEFKECHSLVDYQHYFEECMEDVCGCMMEPTSCSCLSLSSYAAACARKGKALSWRQSLPVCGIPCPIGQIYLPCANPCTYTCAEIANSYSNCREECVEGCVCPPGQTLDIHRECVAVSACSCLHSGHIYPPEFMQRRGKEMCECAQGQWACHEASPADILLTPPPHVAPDCDASANLESTDCVSECPLTCSNLHHHQPCTTAICVPGCRCKKGYIMDTLTDSCVKPLECPCHHSGKSYEEGEQVVMDCHTCTCESGVWDCDSNPCPGHCSAWGDSHYETFDGRLFDFEGSCDYVMVKAHVTESVIFSVVIQNIPCGGNGGATCGKSLSITLGEQSVTLTRDHPIPDVPESSRLSVSSVGMFTLVDSDIGISIQWDRNSRVYVIAQPIWEHKLQGLCGDFNSDSSDDFRSPSGGIPLVLAKDFADSWRVHKYCKPATLPENACDKNPERRTWSKHKCSVLKSELFQPCHYQVEVDEYFKRCVLDACACNSGGDCECLCAVVSAYAQKCARRGVVIPWRSQDLCPVQCEACDRYNPCISLCPPPNCDNYLDDSQESGSCSRQPCVDGCEPKPCESGQVHKSSTNLTCIPETFCTEKPCTVIDGVPYREGERIENKDIGDSCQSCYCRRGGVDCVGVPCTSPTPTPKPIITVELEACEFTGWTDWINSVDPYDNNGDDEENLEDLLIVGRIPCSLSNITSIQCRVAATQEPAESVKQDVTCDLENGLRCKHGSYNGDCEDYEMRVYCECQEEVTCPPGQEWNSCAFSCNKLCHAMEMYLDEENACEQNQECVSGCVKEVCEPAKLARDAETCVTPEKCTCRLSSGYVIAPGEVITDGCQKCQCLNNTLICSTTLECKEIEEVPPAPTTEETYIYPTAPTSEVPCTTGWSEWESFHLPDRKGERESLENFVDEEILSCSLLEVTEVQCREVKTSKLLKYPGQNGVYCDLKHNGFECNNRDFPRGKRCADYAIRAYCDCEKAPRYFQKKIIRTTTTETPMEVPEMIPLTPSPYITPSVKPRFGIITTTPSCSYWSDWINKGKPRRGKKYGDKEDTKPYILKQTEGFCLDGYISDIECKEASTGRDYTETNEERLICDLNRGFLCQNKYQPDNRCQDYKIRYFCNCGEERTEVPLIIKTTPEAYIYPCSQLTPLIDGPRPIPDSRIKASSSDSYRNGPDAIKMKSKGRRKAWTAGRVDTKQFVEVDLGDVRAVYGIVTKGKEDADEWVTSYQLLYSNDGNSYSYYQDEEDNNKVFSGNYDDSIEVKHLFSQPFEARYVRLEPLTWEERISLRMDLLGCAKAITRSTTRATTSKVSFGVTETPFEVTEFPYEVTEVPSEIPGIPFGVTGPEEECKAPMGLENDNAGTLSASSFYDTKTSPEKGRMGSDSGWVAGVTNINQYLQVEFPEEATITGVVTKGREDLPHWVRLYMVAYSNDGKNWEKVLDENDQPIVFQANSNQYARVTNMFPTSVNAQYIRIQPVSWKTKISMQVEILGCLPEEEEEMQPKALDLTKRCKKRMGLDNGLLMDSQISASSSYSSRFTPENARLGSDSVWAAEVQDEDQYLQVDFVDPQRVAGIITKGREDIPQWVTAYFVEFSKDGTKWNKIKEKNGDDKEFPANYDPFSTVENLLPSTIRTRFLRIRPTKWKNWISMQIEILGCYHPQPCRDLMGVDNGIITDFQLSASSEISKTLSANNGRLSSPTAWSPDTSDKNPFIQVDLLEPVNLTAVVTKGNPEIQQWVKSYYVAYSNDSADWRKVENIRGKAKEFVGNTDQDSAVINLFPITITARYVRIIPLDWHRRVALRIELLGCFHEKVCLEPMGLENGLLADAQITASSSSDPDTTPSHGRLSDKSGWQPNKSDKRPYLQIDLLDSRNVSAVVTKGMEDADNWVTKFKIVVSDDRRQWYPLITEEGDDVVFEANEDRNTPVVNMLPEIVEARYFRIIPLDFENDIGLRFELLGCYHPNECQEPMGMETGSVLDYQISASSFLSDEFSPAKARLDSDTAWVADISDDEPYIQVDFIVPTNLTGIMTRGRNDANEWVKAYKIDYSMDGDSFFSETGELLKQTEFPANSDSESTVTNIFEEPIFARVLRIIPTKQEKKASMRLEVLGCFHKTECMEPMGLENGLLEDSHISATSYKSEETDPTKLRLNSDTSWMPDIADDDQFIQVDFLEPRNVSAVVTKGHATEPIWVTTYQLAFSDDGEDWTPVDDGKEFPANTDNVSPVINVFPETVEARSIRIIPTEWKSWIALRAEILGCYHPYEEPVPEVTTVFIPEIVMPFAGTPTEPPMVVQCPDPMEPEISLMKGARLKASSSTPTGSPTQVLLHTQAVKGLSGGWVPRVDDLHPVLLIQLPETRWLTSMYIQGRTDEENWVKTLRIIGSSDNDTWMPVFGPDGDEIIEGNTDQETVVGHYFKEPVEVKYIKIVPETWHRWPSFRIDLRGCRTAEATVLPISPSTEYPELCPELVNYPHLAQDCPEECLDGQLCDGEECVDPVDCACVHEGKIFKVSDRIEDRSCRQCDCSLGGHSICNEKQCEPCDEGETSVLSDDCLCTCEECEEGEKLCPSSLECIPEERWCDGIVDCPDDETNCYSTTTLETTTPGAFRKITPKAKARRPVAPALLPELPEPTLPPEIPGPPGNGTCSVMGNHVETFDGQDIIYDACNHVVFKDIKNEKYNVTIHKECGYVSECKHWIEINYLNQHIKVQSDLNVEVNGHGYSTTQLWRLSKNTKMNIVARKVGEQVIITSLSDNFTIIYDVRGHLEIDVAPELLEKVSGLCGYYSGKVDDDQRKPNGKKAFTSREFGESWAVNEKGKKCKPHVCPHEQIAKSMELCHKLKEDPFIPCAKLLPLNQLIEFCISTTCECLVNEKNSENKCKCDGLLPFVEACESKLGPLAVRNWRLIHECHTECPPGMEWNDCGPSCQLTCDSTSEDTLHECSGRCVPGCFCPPGTVLNDEECIPPDQCRDQVCQGFGDPHFRTFDGLFFPFQAIGSFLIVSDTGKNFEVKGLSKKCGLFNPITCLVGMEIAYKKHKISIKKSKELRVDGKKLSMDKLPLHKDGMVILGYPGRTFVVVIPAINMEARYYEENSGFAVRVPSRKYFNKTRGLCGNCNGREDDELKNEPLNKYVCSWQTDGKKEDCMKELEELPDLLQRVPICEKLSDPVFEACHPLIDVAIYVDACNFDATHSGDNQASFCKTAMEYGRQCCQAGVIIKDWPRELGCDIDCPSGMAYEQCHKGCPQTCLSKKNESGDLSCKQLKTDGCFCPEGKVLKDDACVDIDLCETCDQDGHVSGDKWNDGPCKHCQCREDLNVECVLEVCPSKPICSKDETLVKKETERETSSCCESYTCVPKEEECPTMEVPTCKAGEVAKVHTGYDTCPILKCECDPLLCAPLVWPEDLEEGQQAVITNETCCPVVQLVCFDELCPDKPDCDDNLELVEVKEECCTNYKCKPPKDVCVYTHIYKLIDGFQSLLEQIESDSTVYQPGEEWDDGLCEKCSCIESKGQYVPLCVMEHCPTLEDMPENKDYVLEELKLPNKCCPDIFRAQCRDNDGNVYEPREQWQDEDNPCVTYLCEQEETGNVVKIKSVINCTECPRTAVLFPPSKALGQCCGFCKPTKCEESDSLYDVGETWVSPDDSCKMAECVSEYGKITVVYTKQPCPTIPKDCPEDKIVLDENGCCQVCNLTSEISCSTGPIPEEDTIGFFTYDEPSEGGTCVNERPVSKVLQCKGACNSRSYYSLEDGEFKDMCQCCKVNVTTNRTVELRCPNGNYVRKTFLQPESCQCSKCAPKSGESKKNSFNKPTWNQENQWNADSDFVIAQSPLDKERITQQKGTEQKTLNSWQFEQNQVQQEEEDF